ncbi:MAG: hypothetical protein U9Q85_01905 [Patescibacteria group bacterium]|nr:hypothetical protein [Patescibacteria group bacterium]
MKISKLAYFLALPFLFVLGGTSAQAVTFNPNNIISNAEMLDSSSMSLAEITAFLNSKNGYISKHKFPNYASEIKSAAEIIYEAANNYDCEDTSYGPETSRATQMRYCTPTTINPKALLVLLQKEQSLIEEVSPRQSQLDWAMGYGCPDGGGCNDRWKGFGKQVNSAGLQFYNYMMNPNHYSYRPNNTYNVSNTGRPDSTVHIENKATAALYNYTPHVYNGNFNFFKLWIRYFTMNYPDNTLMQVTGEPGVWLIQNGYRRPFHSRGALTSRYNLNKIIQVSKSDLERYPLGNPIKFSQYSLVRSPRGTVYLLIDDMRRGFASSEALRKVGINPEEIIDASWQDINLYTEAKPITATTSYPTGALLQDKSTGGIYFVSNGTKAPLWDAILLKTKFRNQVIIAETPEKLSSYKTVEPAIFNDGELIKTSTGPGVFVIDKGTRRAFTSGDIFEELGYRWNNIITVPKKIFDLYPEGEPIAQIYSEEDIEIVDPEIADELASTSDEELLEEIEDILNP